MIVGIVVALPEELKTLTSKTIERGRVTQIAEDVFVICSGVGSTNAGNAAALLVAQGVNALVSWGCAAALDSTFSPGDLILTGNCIAVDGTAVDVIACNDRWVEAVQQQFMQASSFPIHTGKLAGSKSLIAFSHEKSKIALQTGAVALDMESVAIARIADSNRLSFLAIRAIADPADMDLPAAVCYSLNEQGEVVISKLLMYLLKHPAELPGLFKLGLHFQSAKKSLSFVASKLNYLTTQLVNPL